MSNSIPVVPEETFLEEPLIVRTVERLNSIGLAAINQSFETSYPSETMPLIIVRPPTQLERPLNDYEAYVIRPLAYGTGHHHVPTRIESALHAELFGLPVINIPAISRSWGGMHSLGPVRGWYGMSENAKYTASIELFDANSKNAQAALDKLQAEHGLQGRAHIIGESMGAAVGASLAKRLRYGHDILSLTGMAIPNTSTRAVYKELLLRDFVHSGDMPGGMSGQMCQGQVALAPYLEAAGIESGVVRTNKQELISSVKNFMQDALGGVRLTNFRRSESFSRALSQPTARAMLAPLLRSKVTVALGFGENDPVSRPADAEQNLAPLLSNPLLHLMQFGEGRDHAVCVNRYAVSYLSLVAAGLITKTPVNN